MTAGSLTHGMTDSRRSRNFSRRVVFFFAANSAWEKLGGCVLPASLGNTSFIVATKSKMDGLNQRLLKEIAVGAAKDARTLRPLAVGTFRKRFPISIGGRAPAFLPGAVWGGGGSGGRRRGEEG